MKLLTLLCLAIPFAAAAADIPSEPLAQQGDPLLSDDFERAGLGDWKSLIPTFTVTNGVLKGVQTRADHGAVGRVYGMLVGTNLNMVLRMALCSSFDGLSDLRLWRREGILQDDVWNDLKDRLALGDTKEFKVKTPI